MTTNHRVFIHISRTVGVLNEINFAFPMNVPFGYILVTPMTSFQWLLTDVITIDLKLHQFILGN